MKFLIPTAVRKIISGISSKLVYLNFNSLVFQSSICLWIFQGKRTTMWFALIMLFSPPCIAAFICHHNCFLVYGSLEEPTVAKWSHIIHVSTLISVFISILFATCGYLTFTGYTQGKKRNSILTCFGSYGVVLSLLILSIIIPNALLQSRTHSLLYLPPFPNFPHLLLFKLLNFFCSPFSLLWWFHFKAHEFWLSSLLVHCSFTFKDNSILSSRLTVFLVLILMDLSELLNSSEDSP